MDNDKTDENIKPTHNSRDVQHNKHKDILEEAKKFLGDKIEGLKNLKYEDIPTPVRGHIERHPRLTAVQLVLIILTLAPGLIIAPALGTVGFSSIGPVAGKRASNRSNPLYSLRA
jgi:hypothetical protein